MDMGYFCRCLGEGFKEEGFRCTGFAEKDDNSVVVEDNDDATPQEERTTYSV